jgi:hypothetical protein
MSATLDSMRRRPVFDVAAEQAERLRSATGRPAARGNEAVRARIEAQRAQLQAEYAAHRAATGAPARPEPKPVVHVGDRPTYAQIDALAATVPVGYYALPRREASSNGNTVTFFKVHPFRGGRRIVQIIGSTAGYTERPLPVNHQFHALRHIAEDVAAAASLYGREAKRCGFCAANGRNSRLTNDRSRAVGYGERCAEIHGLPW